MTRRSHKHLGSPGMPADSQECLDPLQAGAASKPARFLVSGLNSTATKWTGAPWWRYLSTVVAVALAEHSEALNTDRKHAPRHGSAYTASCFDLNTELLRDLPLTVGGSD